MRPSRLLSHDRIALGARLADADAVLQHLAGLLADGELPAARLLQLLARREQSGSTALGDGVAIPHARIESLEQPRAAFLSLGNGVAFGAPDGAPVDLFFALLVPAHATGEHLSILAGIAERFGDGATRAMLRRARTSAAVLDLLGDSLSGAAA